MQIVEPLAIAIVLWLGVNAIVMTMMMIVHVFKELRGR